MLGGAALLVWGIATLRPSAAGPSVAAAPTALSVATMTGSAGSAVELAARPQLTPLGDALPNPNLPSSYTVQPGDGLSTIAARFGLSQEALMEANGISDPNTVFAGQLLTLPTASQLAASAQQLLPDSELVYGPAYGGFDLRAFVTARRGYLANYQEEVEGQPLNGVEIVERVSQRYSVGPRVLLALLEYASGWVTDPSPSEIAQPAGLRYQASNGLFRQLSAAATALNQGYYDVADGRSDQIVFADGTVATVDPTTNAGSAALQMLFARHGTADSWGDALASDGYIASYRALFGDPWAYEVADLLPTALNQPALALPWAAGEQWYFTGGPHGGWADSASWAAIDFAAPDITGCYYSEHFVRSASAGRVIRSENGEVVVDLDGDGFVGTGWTLLYMHMAERVPVGTELAVGDVIGRPSCEGGVSDAAHLHIARRYNGQWIAAAGAIPLTLGGWTTEGASQSYDGFLVRDGERKEACACRDDTLNGLVAP